MGEWIPILMKNEEVGSVGYFRKTFNFVSNAFWPLSPRENIIECSLYALYDQSTFAFPFKTNYDTIWFGHEIKKTPDTVFMDIHKAYLELKPMNPKKTNIRLIIN